MCVNNFEKIVLYCVIGKIPHLRVRFGQVVHHLFMGAVFRLFTFSELYGIIIIIVYCSETILHYNTLDEIKKDQALCQIQ